MATAYIIRHFEQWIIVEVLVVHLVVLGILIVLQMWLNNFGIFVIRLSTRRSSSTGPGSSQSKPETERIVYIGNEVVISIPVSPLWASRRFRRTGLGSVIPDDCS
jgi:hypothetical protein